MATNKLLMIRPVNFSFNAETAVNNAFQVPGEASDTQAQAEKEFNAMVETLRAHGVDVTVIDDTPLPYTPDSIFPNNWISFHDDGTVVLYPMFAPNRRAERKPAVMENLFSRFRRKTLLDLSNWETKERFLEGTGSMVLDRENKIAYACLSPRTDLTVLHDFCHKMDYRPVAFHAVDPQGQPIYHTNVMMCVADRYAVVCLEAVKDEKERQLLVDALQQTGKEIVTISTGQMNAFAGNMLQVSNHEEHLLLVMSRQAHDALTQQQLARLQSFNPVVTVAIDTIEKNGGGSARCMMAEIYLPEKN